MKMRWTEADRQDFEKRASEWRATGTTRSHTVDDPKIKREPMPKPFARLAERDVVRCSMEILENHPAVAFAWRQNTGLAFGRGQAVRFSFVGCSDLLGMLKDGRFLAIECKATGKELSADQEVFLDAVNASGGFGICVDDPQQLIDALEGLA